MSSKVGCGVNDNSFRALKKSRTTGHGLQWMLISARCRAMAAPHLGYRLAPSCRLGADEDAGYTMTRLDGQVCGSLFQAAGLDKQSQLKGKAGR